MKFQLKMKPIISFFLGIIAYVSWGQTTEIEPIKKKFDTFNVFLDMQSSFNSENATHQPHHQSFTMPILRLEFRGDINEHLFYKLRHRLNKSSHSASLDNLSDATDMMYVGVRFNQKWSALFGKISQEWGGFEFDPNPIFIYEYSEFINHMDNYFTGGSVMFQPNENHEFILNITNARTEKFEHFYKDNLYGIKASNTPLAYLLNWNGHFFNGKLQTRWAVGYHQEAEHHANIMAMLGTKLNLQKVQFFVDFYHSDEALDRLNYENKTIGGNPILTNVSYSSWIGKFSYQPSQKWNLFAQGMYETLSLKKLPEGITDAGKTIWGYQTGVEYTPFKNQNLKLFAVYLGKNFRYTFKEMNHFTNRFSLGFIYFLKAF